MRYKPWDYQERAKAHILENKASALFLDMGLGKTVITLTALNEMLNDYYDIGRILIVAPKRVATKTWPDELKKWDHLSGLSYKLLTGTLKQRLKALSEPADIYIINRENLVWLVNTCKPWTFDCVVLDELSSFKSYKARRTRAICKVRSSIKRIIGLTGTPAPRSLEDLWSELYILDGGIRLGKTLTGYRETYFIPGARRDHVVYEWILKNGSADMIYKKISDICISMSADDYLELPEKIDINIPITLGATELKLIKDLSKNYIAELDNEVITVADAAVLSGKLLQLSSGAIYDDIGYKIVHDKKLEALDELIESANGKSVLIAYWFRHELERLKARYPNGRVIDSDQDIDDWNDQKIQIAFINPASAGHGLNLQSGGHILIWFSLIWDLELYLQLVKRLYRQGQKYPVIVYHLIATGTIDEKVIRGLIKKDLSQSALIEAVKGVVA